MLDTQYYFEKTNCIKCDSEFAIGCIVMGKCPSCYAKENENYYADITIPESTNDSVERKMEVSQMKRIQYFLRIGYTSTGVSLSSRKGSRIKTRYEEFIRNHR